MSFLQILFWICVAIVFYTYIGYGLFIWLLNKIRIRLKIYSPTSYSKDFEPDVALVVAAYNEQDYIEEKIKNSLLLDYPAEKLKIYFVTDGSSDETPAIVSRYPQVILLHSPERKGKAAAINRSIAFIKEPILIFCDANTHLNVACIREIVKEYINPKVGAVAGEKKIFEKAADGAAGAGEGLYWKYESFLKKQDSILYSVVGAAGELISVRKELYEPIEPGIIIEDFVMSLKICLRGYVVKYAPGAFATETASASIKDEQKRKIRICAGGFQAIAILKSLLNLPKYGLLSFQYISHRVLRWTLSPLALLLLLPLNLALVMLHAGFFYQIILALQLIFYVLGITGWLLATRNLKVKSLYVPYYFLFMNVSVFWGFKRYLQGKQTVLWEKAARQKIA